MIILFYNILANRRKDLTLLENKCFKNNYFSVFWDKLCTLKEELNNTETKINLELLFGSIMKFGLLVDGDQVIKFLITFCIFI